MLAWVAAEAVAQRYWSWTTSEVKMGGVVVEVSVIWLFGVEDVL